MFIDRILSRFNIQTKVLIFILPFVISISAVGFTGLYASGLLQGRIEISNSVLQSLSGFRDVSASMSSFLANTTEEAKADLTGRLEQQKRDLETTLSQLAPDADGRTAHTADALAQRVDAAGEDADDGKRDREVLEAFHVARQLLGIAHAVQHLQVVIGRVRWAVHESSRLWVLASRA